MNYPIIFSVITGMWCAIFGFVMSLHVFNFNMVFITWAGGIGVFLFYLGRFLWINELSIDEEIALEKIKHISTKDIGEKT